MFLLLAPATAPALQILPSAAPTPTATPTRARLIPVKAADSDSRIAGRIRGIFSQLPALAQVTVQVKQGVVTLGGKVEDASDKAKAEGIASRVADVVTVEDQIQRDRSVGNSVAGVKAVSDKFVGLANQLPLIGAALIVALIIGAIGYAIAGMRGVWERITRNPFLAELIASAIRFVFVLGGIVLALDMLGAGALLGAVLGGAGVIGLALGFAMRDTIENYVSSLMLSLRQPFRANDMVRIDNCEGRVIRLTTRATILMTSDGNHLRVPNSTVFKAVILNYTSNPHRRFDFVVQIDAKADPAKARHCGLDALRSVDCVLKDPAPAAVVQDMVYPYLAIQFLGWVDQSTTDFAKGRTRAFEAVKRALDDNGLALPDPTMRVRMDGEEERPSAVPPPASPSNGDVAPEKAITEMVEKERSRSSEGKKDLLDDDRPQE